MSSVKMQAYEVQKFTSKKKSQSDSRYMCIRKWWAYYEVSSAK